jgi:arsenite-transporting ATPase
VRVIAEAPQEPRGVAALARIGTALTAQRAAASLKSQVSSTKAAHVKLRPSHFKRQASDFPLDPAELDALLGAKLLFFGGKGGVGKTTVAAAAALRIAAAHPDRRVLVMSTDPAHSLGDAFDATLGDAPAAVRGAPANLRVRELDAARALAVRRAALASALDELGDAFDTGGGGARASNLLDLAPPGVDELFGMLSVFAAGADFDRIVVDTAPTGHALRLLEMPQIVHEWVQLLMRVLLKYKAVAAPGALGAELVDLARAIRELRRLLADARQTRFVVVTRMADVPAAETARLLRSLRRLHIAVPAIVANAMTLAPGRCPRCRCTAAGETRRLAAMRRLARSAVILTPLTAPPPRGVGALRKWGASWING